MSYWLVKMFSRHESEIWCDNYLGLSRSIFLPEMIRITETISRTLAQCPRLSIHICNKARFELQTPNSQGRNVYTRLPNPLKRALVLCCIQQEFSRGLSVLRGHTKPRNFYSYCIFGKLSCPRKGSRQIFIDFF